MEESEDNVSAEDIKDIESPSIRIKSKKRSMVERELETNLTERITSPITNADSTSTSRYGRARRLKTGSELNDSQKVLKPLKSPQSEKSLVKSPVYKMHASNSPLNIECQVNSTIQCNLENQIENIYNENISLSRFGEDNKNISPGKQTPKIYIRKDMIQSKEKDEMVTLIKDIYSPAKTTKNSNTHLSNVLERSSDCFSLNNKQNSLENSSVVKTLDFDGSKKNRKETKTVMSKSELFELEAKCEYQVGDLAWAKMGTYPYWPCIVTRDPYSGMFVKKKLFGRVDRDVIHVIFFGDNGRRSWIMDNMLRKYLGQLEFETYREKFTPDARRKDPRCAAYFVSEKKQPQWTISVAEAETLLREPKRLRIDLLNDMLNKARNVKATPRGRKVTRTDSDVSLSESLYDTLFSEDDSKVNESEQSKNKTRNKSLDVSEVVTACLDNMAAKTGITKIQKQSHMDRWLQKAKSKTPEKSQFKSQISSPCFQDKKKSKRIKKEPDSKPFRLVASDNESLSEVDCKLQSHQNEHDYSSYTRPKSLPGGDIGVNTKIENPSVNNILNNRQNEVVLSDDCVAGEETVVESGVESNVINNVEDNDIKTSIEDAVSNVTFSTTVNLLKSAQNTETKKSTIEKFHSVISEGEYDIQKQTKPEEVIENGEPCDMSMEWTPDDVTNEDDQANQDVNIAKKILSDNLVGNIIDFNKTDSIIEMSDISIDEHFNLNDDSDLTISETSGHPNGTNISDGRNIVYDNAETKSAVFKEKIYKNLRILEDYSSTDSSQYNVTENNVHNNKISFNINNKLVGAINNITSDLFHENNTRTDRLKPDKYLTSKEYNNKNITRITNGYSHDNIIESDSTIRNSDSYLSADDERSTNSTPSDIHNFEVYSTIDKRKKNLVQKFHKHLKVQEFQRVHSKKKFSLRNVDQIRVYDSFNERDISQEEISLDDSSQTTTEGTDRCSIDSNYTCESDNKSVYSDEQTESTESTETMDIDESTIDSLTQNGYHDTSNKDIENEPVDTCKSFLPAEIRQVEQVTSDEIRLIQNDLETDIKNDDTKNTENSIDKIKEEHVSTDSVASSTFDYIKQNVNAESINNNYDNESGDNYKETEHMDCTKEKAIMNGDELRFTPKGLEIIKENDVQINIIPDEVTIKEELGADTASIISTDSEMSLSKRRMRWKVDKACSVEKKTVVVKGLEDPEFLKYLELKQDSIYDEHPELSQDEITTYLYNTWLYEEGLKTDMKKTDDMESATMVKGLQSEAIIQTKKVRKRVKVEKEDYEPIKEEEILPKQKPKRRTVRPSYNEEYSDVESDLEVYKIFKPKRKELKVMLSKTGIDTDAVNSAEISEPLEIDDGEEEEVDEVEEYFAMLTEPKPNVFKGLLREKVCEICEKTSNLVKCKGCSCMFHVNCVKKETEVVEVQVPMKGRKKKKKYKSRKSKSDDNVLDGSHSDEKDVNVSEEFANTSIENVESKPHIVFNAEDFEAQLTIKMKELLDTEKAIYDTFSSDDELEWSDTEVGKCKVVDIKLRKRSEHDSMDYSEFKCNNCQKYDTPVCFVCRDAASPKTNALHRQRCQVAQCNKYYHLECLEHWPQTQFNSGECVRYNKKINEYFEALSCPRHVCHTCVSDDPRGCKTRFSGDKLARCVRCPATYHSFTKCLPAGSQILTGSHIICPRHYEHRPGKVPCHVNTGWCFICALGGTLICCEYCPTSFHAECLNIKPPEGSYMCEDCETGRLPLYGEMVWVKLGHYRWWPGIILHPCEIPENILATKHSPGEFVVRFFGQYDHYWVNRGRVFPFQEGDSGKVSSQKSKIDAAFTMAMEHAQRACEILKLATENEEESLDIASSLLPPHYVKLRANKPSGALAARRAEPPEGSLTQCECDPADRQPCGPFSHCLNRMLLTECGPTCRSGDRCNNRAFEKRLYPKLVPYRTPHRGWGLKTLEDIKAGQFVIEYVGELIDEEEFQRRMRRKHEIRDENFYFLTLDKERMIDAGPKGNLARFMNHCCEPNCETQKWTVLGDIRVGLFALYDIPANSEVTFNYNLESAGIEKKRCLCGAKRCSGYIGAKPKQLQVNQPKKTKVAAKRVYKKRKIEDSPSSNKIKPKLKLGRPAKPKELTDIEKDLLIIKNATNGISSDSDCSGRLSSIESGKDLKALKRKRVEMSTEEALEINSSSMKKMKSTEDKPSDLCD